MAELGGTDEMGDFLRLFNSSKGAHKREEGGDADDD